MPEDNGTQPLDNQGQEVNPDPLGILGWVIAGKYKVQAYLGGGGFGEVYEGFNENLPEQRLVLKFFKRVQAREKFAKEAKILCMLDHPNICRVIDYLPDEGAVVVAFIDGRDGGVILKESGALPEQLFLKVAQSITSAIAYAHEKKIAHRDIKPGNIIVDKNENVFLIDFGIAKEMGTEATKTAYTALTPMFAAPERQIGEKNYNPFLSDIYETGITLFNLATNSLPYRNPTNPEFNEWGGMAAKRLSPELTRILKKATHPDPAGRYSSASELAADMKNLRLAFGRPRRRSSPVTIVSLIVLLAIAGYMGRDHISDYWTKYVSPYLESFQTTEPAVTIPEAQQEQITTEEGELTDQQPFDDGIVGEAIEIQEPQPEVTPTEETPSAVTEKRPEKESQPKKTESLPPEEVTTPKESPPTVVEKKPEKESEAKAEEPPPPVITPQKDAKPVVKEEKPESKPVVAIKEQPVIQEKTSEKEPEPKTEPTPPPPLTPMANILLSVIPEEDAWLMVGGTVRQAGTRFDIEPGHHKVVVIQPDYPIYRSSLDAVEGQVDVAVNLVEEFKGIDTLELQIALIPPTDKHILTFTRNGRRQMITNFPHLGLRQMTGDWNIQLSVQSIESEKKEAQIDSCVIFPFNPELRSVIQGSSGTLKVRSSNGEEASVARLLIYWMEE
jgi:serine/threonine-protein kinase